jgi:hypothetical protein
MQLLDLLLIELQSVRATIPPPHETRSAGTSESLPQEEISPRSVEELPTTRTTEARLDELLRMLAPLSETSLAKTPHGGAPGDYKSSASEVPAPVDVESSRADAPGRTRQSAEAATRNPTARETHLSEHVESPAGAASGDKTASNDWQAPLLDLARRSATSPGSKRGAQPVSANDDPKWTASASSCVDCHRARGIR